MLTFKLPLRKLNLVISSCACYQVNQNNNRCTKSIIVNSGSLKPSYHHTHFPYRMLLWQLWEFGVKSRQAFFFLLICLITCLLDILIGFIWKENINIDHLGLKRVIIIIIIWVALWAGKMNQIPCCDWLSERARWSDLARLGLRALSRKKNFSLFGVLSHIINPLSLFGQDGWVLASFFFFWECLWTETKRTYNKANIHPSWPLAWSITHTYCYWLVA